MLTVEDFALIEEFSSAAGNVISADNMPLRRITNQGRSMLINSWVPFKGSEKGAI